MITIACCGPSVELRVLGVTCELASDQGVVVCLAWLSEVDIGCLLGSKGDGMRRRRVLVARVGEVALPSFVTVVFVATVDVA